LPKNAIVDEKPPRGDPGAPDNTNRWDARYQSTKASRTSRHSAVAAAAAAAAVRAFWTRARS